MFHKILTKKIHIILAVAILFVGLFAVVNADTVQVSETVVQTNTSSSSISTSVNVSVTATASSYSCVDHDPEWEDEDHKVKICHHTESESTPQVTITIDKSALSAHLGHDDYKGACKPPEPKGSIRICKIIVDEEKNVLYNFTGTSTPFSIFGIDPVIHSDGGDPVGVLATSTFTTPLSLNTKIFNSSTGNDAQCVTHNNLKLGDYYYGEEILSGNQWLTPLYNDQFNTTVASTSDFFSYSNELFTATTTDDVSRNKDSDGHVVLSNDHPNRTLMVLNTVKNEPEPEVGSLNICKWNDVSGDGKSATTTDDVALGAWRFLVNVQSGTSTPWDVITKTIGGCSLTEDLPVGTYSITEEQRENWTLTDVYVDGVKKNINQATSTLDVIASIAKGATTRVDFYNHYQEPATTTPSLVISATKIVCDLESDLPHWGAGGPDITAQTAVDWVATHVSCRLQDGWRFQYASSTVANPGDNIGEASGWNTFGPTNEFGVATTTIKDTNLINGNRIWVREVMRDGYIPFAGVDAITTVSAELYCAQDVLNYDNYDFISSPKAGNTYSCVAWNVKESTPDIPQCSDNADNDLDEATDENDPACHTDGDPDNPDSYDPEDDDENSKPIITLIGDATLNVTAGAAFTDPGATAFDEEDGDLTSMIHATSTVNMAATGTYTIVYGDVVDSKGTAADPVIRTVVVSSGGGGGDPTGSVRICKVIVNEQNTIATSSHNLPFGAFSIRFATSTEIASSTINIASFTASAFTPNATIIQSSDAQCVTYDNLSFGLYYYSEEEITGSTWQPARYNDQLNHPVNNVFDFFSYDDALFTATTTDDASREVNADGMVTLTQGDSTKTIVILNKYSTEDLPQCSDNIDNDLDETTDEDDPACHTDGDPDNPDSYDPDGDDENSKPVITLIGDGTLNLTVGAAFTDPGATASDEEDGDLTSMIHATSTVNMAAAGTYIIVYGDVVDSKGAAADPVTRTVIVSSGGGGGGCVVNCGGGGGGGPPSLISNPLNIFNETVTLVSADSALVSWNTNLPGTSQVLFDTHSHATGTVPSYGYASSTIKVNTETTNHTLFVTGLRGGPPYYFRPISTNNTSTALGRELVISPTTPGICNYLIDYLRIDLPNDPIEVNKLQLFLRNIEGFSNLNITGIFDQATYDAVVSFQEKYRVDVLDPWGHDAGTGYVYITTKKKVNEIYCNTIFPLNDSQNTEIAAFRALLESIQKGSGGSVNPFESVGSTTGTPENGEGTENGESLTGLALGVGTTTPGAFERTIAGVLDLETGPLTALVSGVKNFLGSKIAVPIILFIILLIALILKGRWEKKTSAQ